MHKLYQFGLQIYYYYQILIEELFDIMRNTKYVISNIIIIFLMFLLISSFQILSSYSLTNRINIKAEDNQNSWSKFIKSGSQLQSHSSMFFFDDDIFLLGSIGNYFTKDDIYIARFNNSGAKLWERKWNDSKYDAFQDYAKDSENNIYITCISSNTDFSGVSGKISILKYNTTGNLLWSKTIDPYNCNYYNLYSIKIDLNNSVYLTCQMAGYSIDRSFITKISSSGIILWTQEIGLIDRPFQLRTEIDSKGNIYVSGQGSNLFLLKYNSSFSQLWYKQWGSHIGHEMGLDSDGNIFLTGETYIDIEKYDVWIMKINSSGNLTTKVSCIIFNYYRVEVKTWFLDDIFIMVGKGNVEFMSSLLRYNYSLNSRWNFTFEDFKLTRKPHEYKFGINSKKEMYLLLTKNPKIKIIHFNDTNLISYFEWGGYYSTNLYAFCIDSNDNLYMLCQQHYSNVWFESTSLSLLVKNPMIGGRAPLLNQPIDDRDIFLFSFFGVMSLISISLIYNILKPKLRKL